MMDAIRIREDVVRVKREPRSIPVSQALIAVQDQGPGIRPEAQNEIFRRFYREPGEDQKHVEGLGLGLYVAHEIVMRHGGRVWVESTVGRGSTFYIALPLLEEIAESEPIVNPHISLNRCLPAPLLEAGEALFTCDGNCAADTRVNQYSAELDEIEKSETDEEITD